MRCFDQLLQLLYRCVGSAQQHAGIARRVVICSLRDLQAAVD
jgi:hypothetical protein